MADAPATSAGGTTLTGGTISAGRAILVFGDSLSAGYGIPQDAAWPSLLQQRLRERKYDYTVINASISGETSAGGRQRIGEALRKYRPALVILALGANDGLRGLPVATMRDNLAAIVRAAQQSNARVLIVGMRLPPNYGAYADSFHRSFSAIAETQKAAYVPFLLEGVAADREHFQPDGLHPTARAQAQLLENVWPALAGLL